MPALIRLRGARKAKIGELFALMATSKMIRSCSTLRRHEFMSDDDSWAFAPHMVISGHLRELLQSLGLNPP
jgi:hypothetical protein